VVYVAADVVVARHGARHRKRSGDQQPSESEQQGSGAAIAIGALLDGFATVTTVGYRDRFPMNGTGRFVAVGLMVGGFAFLGW
jgi:hypothetical protein